MTDRILRAALVALCLAGVLVAGYLLSARWGHTELICSTGGCETVQSSSYAELFGIPVAAAGLVGYLLIGASALVNTAPARPVGAALALGALAFSAYLLVIQLAVIGAVCDWCLASDAISTVVAGLALLRLRQATAAPAGRILMRTT
jgi:uncharacterized membrane protein